VTTPGDTPNRSTPLIDRYASGGALLAYAAAGLTTEQTLAHPGPGEWSIAQLVVHLLDSDLVYADRMKRVIAEDDPVLQAFDENAWAARLGPESMSPAEAVELLKANRRWMVQVLRRCADADFARTGMHTERGRMTLADLLATATNHLDHHLRFLYAKRSNLGVALPPRYGSEAIGV
jgi:uncharacterized damage-inducible protein DinB